MPSLLGSEKHAALATEMLRGAATIEILSVDNLKSGNLATVKIRVRNVGAGHKLPTCFPEGREMWVDFRVMDDKGREIYRLGRINEEGFIEKGTHLFRGAPGDKDGNIIDIEVWNATSILYDSRILPRGYADVTFDFKVPEDSEGTLTIKADLCYHSFPQATVNYLLGNKAPIVPTVIMTSLTEKKELR